jgi:hypothetical protein
MRVFIVFGLFILGPNWALAGDNFCLARVRGQILKELPLVPAEVLAALQQTSGGLLLLPREQLQLTRDVNVLRPNQSSSLDISYHLRSGNFIVVVTYTLTPPSDSLATQTLFHLEAEFQVLDAVAGPILDLDSTYRS